MMVNDHLPNLEPLAGLLQQRQGMALLHDFCLKKMKQHRDNLEVYKNWRAIAARCLDNLMRLDRQIEAASLRLGGG